MLKLSKLKEITKWEFWVQYENPVTVDPYMAESYADPVTSRDWIIKSEQCDSIQGWRARVYEGGSAGTISSMTYHIHVYSYPNDRVKQRGMAFAVLTAQITEAYHSYSENPHTGEIIKEPEFAETLK